MGTLGCDNCTITAVYTAEEAAQRESSQWVTGWVGCDLNSLLPPHLYPQDLARLK